MTRTLLGARFFNFGAFATFVRHLDFVLGAAATFVRWLFQVSQSAIFRSSPVGWPSGTHGSAENPAERSTVPGAGFSGSIGKSGLFRSRQVRCSCNICYIVLILLIMENRCVINLFFEIRLCAHFRLYL